MAHTVVGTAGHIDHGKTLLVKALTGTDTDRAPEEKARGITIELGFAFMGDDIAIIDVPGHERFVKTMVAGVSAIDVALLVIAADDGIMPQSREHLDILNLLGVKRGIIALNKVDLVEEEWVELAGPLLGAALAVGLLIGIFQAATQIQEMTLSFIPKLLALVIALFVGGPWMIQVLVTFSQRLITSIPGLIG